jgi:hypothetical protein
MAMGQPIQPGEDRTDGALVLQPRPPLSKRLCLLEFDHM